LGKRSTESGTDLGAECGRRPFDKLRPGDASADRSRASLRSRCLVRQARDLIYDPDSSRNEFGLAENLLKRATDLAPHFGARRGARPRCSPLFLFRAYDVTRQRLVRLQGEAEKALRLEARNPDALLALGLHRQVLGEKDRAKDYLDRALAADPQKFKVILAQSLQIFRFGARAKFLLDAAGTVVAARGTLLLFCDELEVDEAV